MLLTIAVTLLGGFFFWWSGGLSLVRLSREYLAKDIPDKKYNWQDFTDRGAGERLHGYYAGSVGESVYIWTLGGLRRFRHKQTTSVYYYDDMCGAIERLLTAKASGKEIDKLQSEPLMTYDLQQWRGTMRRGDYVWVKRVGDGKESRVIDKMWGSSNKYYPIRGMTQGECQAR